jgi:hypothetical protein
MNVRIPLCKMVRTLLAAAAVALAALTPSLARADVVVSTITGTGPGVTPPAWNGTTSISPWGTVSSGATPTYGETFFTPPGNPVLTGMTFEIQNTSGSPIPFQAYVYQWTGTNITGPALFTSAPMAVTSSAGFQAITVNTDTTVLTPGQQYVAFFSTIGQGGSNNAAASWGYMQSPPGDLAYSGGSFWFNNSSSFPALSSPATWVTFNNDLAFTLTFAAAAAVPEPTSLALFGLGTLGLAGWRLRKKS